MRVANVLNVATGLSELLDVDNPTMAPRRIRFRPLQCLWSLPQTTWPTATNITQDRCD